MHLTPFTWLGATFYALDGGLVAALLTRTEYGQAGVGLLVAFVGFILNRKTKQIHVLVNSRMTDATNQIRAQHRALTLQDARIAKLEGALSLAPGEDVSK